MSKETADWLYGVIVTITAIISPVAAATIITINWIKSRGINKKKMVEVEAKTEVIGQDIKELKNHDLNRKEEYDELKKDIEKLDRDYHDLVIFLLDRK